MMNVAPSGSVIPSTLVDLARVSEKAELVRGEVVLITPTGHRPNLVAGRIFRSLAEYAEAQGRGIALTDNMGFAVRELASGRESFSPDAAYYSGPLPANPMRFVEAPPDFAAEVRSENDYGPAEEARLAAKRADYFEAGTQVVWDVDPETSMVRAYRSAAPDEPRTFGPGQEADAEPAVPGWRVSVQWLMA